MNSTLLLYYSVVRGIAPAAATTVAAQAPKLREKITSTTTTPLKPITTFDFGAVRHALVMYEVALGCSWTMSAEERARRRQHLVSLVVNMP